MSRTTDVAIVGAGIAGLAHALAAARQGRTVVVFERAARAQGASVRNFGLVWPIGQRSDFYGTALRGREVWLEIAKETGMWLLECGSLSVARHEDELAVMEQFLDANPAVREQGTRIVGPDEVVRRSPAVRRDGLLGALWSPTELNVDPRLAVPAVTGFLQTRYDVRFELGTCVLGVDLPRVHTTRGTWQAEQVVVCSGADHDLLYPEAHEAAALQRCKLQMMRTVPQPQGWALGPALCSGLSLLHYAGYEQAPGLPALRDRLDRERPHQRRWGVHALVSQTPAGELSLGDSHEYAADHDPFLREPVNQLVLDYLDGFAVLPDARIAERWHGVYATARGGDQVVRTSPAPGVTIVNGFGGAGMTLSFGVAEETFPSS